MSRTNCFLPNKGFCLNLRVRMVKSPIASSAITLRVLPRTAITLNRLSQNGYGRVDDVEDKL